ncbi:cell separation during budding [Mucor circinelloides]
MAHREGITTTPSDWTMVKASTLVKDQEVITIEGSLPVEEACNVLINNNISSAPVYDAQVKEVSDNSIIHARSYVGMFDYGDVIAYILLVLQNMPPPGDEEEELDGKARENLTFEIKDIVRRALEGEDVPVKLASDLSQKNPFYSIMPEATLLSAVEEFAYGTHRVCVLNPDGTIKGILSQSTVAKYIFDNQRHFPDIECMMNKTLRQLGLGVSDVIAVNADSPVLDALALMSKHDISSVAVLGHMGVVLGNISMTDVKHVVKSYRHQLLWKTCFQFVSLVRTQQGIDDGQDRLPVFDVRLDTTLGFAVAKLLATKSHRVWVIDERERAIGVLSITDVMRAIASSAGVEIKPQSRQE